MNEKTQKASAAKKRTDAPKAEQTKAPKKKRSWFGTFLRRFFLMFFTVLILLVVGLAMVLNLVFNGPSPAARNVLTMSLLEPSATKWIPGLFMDKGVVEQIRNAGHGDVIDDTVDLSAIEIDRGSGLSTGSDEWDGHPDGIIIKDYQGKTFNAHIMLVRDPSRVYLGLSSYDGFSTSKPGKRLTAETLNGENAVAAVNAGAFNDDGTAGPAVGSVPAGLTVSGGKVVSDVNKGMVPEKGFCGFNTDDILVVAKSMTKEEAIQQNIRDGCEFGPVLIINGVPNQEVYSGNSGYNPRTVVGQRLDGTVIFVCADGRQAGSLGATYKDMIDILVEYKAYNACNMDGGSSSVMLYRDTYGLFGNAGDVQMINSYSVLQSEPRRMPDYWMVKPYQD